MTFASSLPCNSNCDLLLAQSYRAYDKYELSLSSALHRVGSPQLVLSTTGQVYGLSVVVSSALVVVYATFDDSVVVETVDVLVAAIKEAVSGVVPVVVGEEPMLGVSFVVNVL